MATEIIMPKLSDTMTEGQLGAWRKSVGERVDRGDVIAEVETDKAAMDLEAYTSGILLEQRVKTGELVPVGTVIGLIGEADEAVGTVNEATGTPQPTAPLPPPTAAAPVAATPPPSPPLAPAALTSSGVQAAPIVRRRAAELGIDLASLHGSGPGGRIMLEDLEQPAAAGSKTEPAAAEPPATVAATEVSQLNRMRSAVARTTSLSWQTIPHFYLTRDMAMDRAEQVIREQKAAGMKVSLNALIMAAAARALLRFPALNAGFNKEGLIRYQQVNLGFAVALDDGLQVPVIKAAETKSVVELAAVAAGLAEQARQGRLTPDDISGGSFTVSNLGMYGVDAIVSIIMPGQAAILAFGSVTDRPAVHDGQLVVARILTATLSCDHRIIDGAVAAGFLNEVKRLLEQPAELSG